MRTALAIHPLGIGEVYASGQGEHIACYGLGSCLALFIHDRSNHIGGGAHIFLPEYSSTFQLSATHFAPVAFRELLDRMIRLGANPKMLRAFLFGGNRVINPSADVGSRNVTTVRNLLIHHQIFIAHQEVEGEEPTSVKFETDTGIYQVLRNTSDNSLETWQNVS